MKYYCGVAQRRCAGVLVGKSGRLAWVADSHGKHVTKTHERMRITIGGQLIIARGHTPRKYDKVGLLCGLNCAQSQRPPAKCSDSGKGGEGYGTRSFVIHCHRLNRLSP
jgi:hypothetical protein